MPYFKDTQNKVHFLESAEFSYLLPIGVVEITEQEAKVILNPPKSVPDLIAEQLLQVNASCETSMSAIKAGYPDSEVLSWPKQEEEARAWTADNATTTPLLDALATARGITKADLAARVIEKADLFAQISGQTIGKRQGLEDQLNALLDSFNNGGTVTQAEIEAIAW